MLRSSFLHCNPKKSTVTNLECRSWHTLVPLVNHSQGGYSSVMHVHVVMCFPSYQLRRGPPLSGHLCYSQYVWVGHALFAALATKRALLAVGWPALGMWL
eukprot:5871145-Amphidinium_carterae.1